MTILSTEVNHVATPISFVPLLKICDLEALFRVDKRTIKRWCKRGQLPQPVRIGGTNRWRLQDIEEALDMQP